MHRFMRPFTRISRPFAPMHFDARTSGWRFDPDEIAIFELSAHWQPWI